MSAKPSCRVHGSGYFPRKESNSLAAEASETKSERAAIKDWIPPCAGMTAKAQMARKSSYSPGYARR
jgi:hypothetical protein